MNMIQTLHDTKGMGWNPGQIQYSFLSPNVFLIILFLNITNIYCYILFFSIIDGLFNNGVLVHTINAYGGMKL
jgi:hypothetical protein